MARKLFKRLLTGFIILIPFISAVTLAAFLVKIFDSFFGPLLVRRIFGREISGAGFLTGVIIAFILGTLAETERGWRLTKRILLNLKKRIPFSGQIVDIVEAWKTFGRLAWEQGAFMAPYYRSNSGFAPGVITSIVEVENDSPFITVTFGDIPLPKPLGLRGDDVILTKLSFSETLAYMLSGGLSFRRFGRKLKKQTLSDYIRSNPQILQALKISEESS